MKRILTLFLAVMMVLSIIPFTAVETKAVTLDENEKIFTITYSPGAGKGKSYDEDYNEDDGAYLDSCRFSHPDDFDFAGWKIGGKIYSAGKKFKGNGGSSYTATAQWKDPDAEDEDEEEEEDDKDTSKDTITVTYKPGDGEGKAKTYTYDENEPFKLIKNPFTHDKKTFEGWEYNGDVFKPGQEVKADFDVTFTAKWRSEGITVTYPDDSSSESSSAAPPASSSSSSAAPSTSSSSVAPPPSTSSSSVAPPPSTSSSSTPESSSSEESSSEESSSEPEEEPEETKPAPLAYSISGDIPVTKIEFALDENVGNNPQLSIAAIDTYSVTDKATAAYVAKGDALAAFDISLLVDGLAYTGKAPGTLSYMLNGTQASAESNYKNYVLAMLHPVDANKFDGAYYMMGEDGVCLYDPATGNESPAENIALVEEEGVYRLVIKDAAGLSYFAYKADDSTVVEVNLLSDANAEAASIKISSFSPILLVQLEIGEGKAASGAGIPWWVWVIVGVVVLVIAALVVLFIIGKNSAKPAQPQRTASVSASGITGFDDDEF